MWRTAKKARVASAAAMNNIAVMLLVYERKVDVSARQPSEIMTSESRTSLVEPPDYSAVRAIDI